MYCTKLYITMSMVPIMVFEVRKYGCMHLYKPYISILFHLLLFPSLCKLVMWSALALAGADRLRAIWIGSGSIGFGSDIFGSRSAALGSNRLYDIYPINRQDITSCSFVHTIQNPSDISITKLHTTYTNTHTQDEFDIVMTQQSRIFKSMT